MHLLKRLLPSILVISTCLSGCYNSDKSSKSSKNESSTSSTSKKEAKDSGNSVDTNIVDKYLYNSSYKELVEAEKKGIGLFSSIKLREPLRADVGEIPETPPDEAFEDKSGNNSNETDKAKQEKSNSSETKRENSDEQPELPKPKMFLFQLKSYLKSDIIDNGYLIIYSYSDNKENSSSLVDINYTIHQLKIKTESLETKDNTIRELFKDDETLIKNWDDCYKQLTKAQDTLNKISDSSNIGQYNKEIDLTSINKSYESFISTTDSYLVGFEPNVTKE